jgi:hypothetical protein
MSRSAAVLSLVVGCVLSAPVARAQDLGLGAAWLYGYGGFQQVGMRAYVPAPPYFALHPPVYYGQRYQRPYGESPFAAWPQLQPNIAYQPRPAAARAVTIVNPYACLPGTISPTAPAAPWLPSPNAAPSAVPAPAETPEEAEVPPSPIVLDATVRPLTVENPFYLPELPGARQLTAQAVK